MKQTMPIAVTPKPIAQPLEHDVALTTQSSPLKLSPPAFNQNVLVSDMM